MCSNIRDICQFLFVFRNTSILSFHPVYNFRFKNWKSIKILHAVGSIYVWSCLQKNTSRYPFFASCPIFPNMINPNQRLRPSQPVAHSFPSPFYRIRYESAHKRAIVLRWATVSQLQSFVWWVNGAAIVCTR